METLLLGALAVVFIIAVIALSQVHRLESDLGAVRRRLDTLEAAARMAAVPVAPVAPVPTVAPVTPVAPAPEIAAPPTPAEAISAPPPQSVWTPPVAPLPPQDSPAPAAPPRLAAERMLTERWLVWLGGIALALGGVFLVRMSIELGLLGPTVRMVLGALFGAGLLAAGHLLRRGGTAPWQVPSALVGAGAAILFADLFAAHALYDLLGATPTFVGLALVAAVTVLMALAHGRFVALLGLAGAFAVPLLVQADQPSALMLFAYLLLVSASMLALLRWRKWWWLAWAVLSAAAGWTLLWLVSSWQSGDEAVVGVYLLALFALFAAFRLGVPWVAALALPVEARGVGRVVTAAALTIAALLAAMAVVAGHSVIALAAPLVFTFGCIVFGWRCAPFDRLPWLSAILLAVTAATWTDPSPGPLLAFAGSGAVLSAVAGFAILWRARHPWRWMVLADGAPLLLLAVCYGVAGASLPSWGWTAGALVLAALALAAAERIARHRLRLRMNPALAAAAVGVIAALVLSATFALSQAWLTVALALMLPGIAWVERHFGIAGLRRVAQLLAWAVLARLVLNPEIVDYPLGDGVVNWLAYGYGVPALAFWVAARRFGRSAKDALVAVLDGGAILFAVLLVSLNIHLWMAGSLDSMALPSLAEISLHTIAWLTGAGVLFAAWRRGGGWVSLVGGGVLGGLATLQAVVMHGIDVNPLLTGEPVGDSPVLNTLLTAYAVPALLYAVHVRLAPPRPRWARRVCAGLALAFAFLWATLEVRHAFTGSRLDVGDVTQAEMWVYSAVWSLGGLILLAVGIVRRSVLLRRAGLGVVLVVVAKVFLWDLNQLDGLWRALSFLGLGVVLVGIGGLYRRFAKYV